MINSVFSKRRQRSVLKIVMCYEFIPDKRELCFCQVSMKTEFPMYSFTCLIIGEIIQRPTLNPMHFKLGFLWTRSIFPVPGAVEHTCILFWPWAMYLWVMTPYLWINMVGCRSIPGSNSYKGRSEVYKHVSQNLNWMCPQLLLNQIQKCPLSLCFWYEGRRDSWWSWCGKRQWYIQPRELDDVSEFRNGHKLVRGPKQYVSLALE